MENKLAYCPNCEFELSNNENFCPNCGQENSSRKVSFLFLLKELLEDYFSFDSKFFKSLIPLLFKPGYLAKEFFHGRRVSYIPPFRMYIIVSILHFFVMSLQPILNDKEGLNISEDSKISFTVAGDTLKYKSTADLILAVEEHGGITGYLEYVKAESTFEKLIVTQTVKIAQNNGVGLEKQIMNNISILMFFLLPLFAAFLKLIFRNNQLYYVEHLVLSVHIHSFIFIFQSIYLLFSWYVYDVYSITATLGVITIYTFLSLKKNYEYTNWGTIWRMIILLPTYSLLLLIGLFSAVLVSMAQY
ncbi:MAG: DUF3667 domain-containing protein [Flavobacteriales bacterium]|nr:DUF3667 domain-containing protein [Flavobacteriales bacterium]